MRIGGIQNYNSPIGPPKSSLVVDTKMKGQTLPQYNTNTKQSTKLILPGVCQDKRNSNKEKVTMASAKDKKNKPNIVAVCPS